MSPVSLIPESSSNGVRFNMADYAIASDPIGARWPVPMARVVGLTALLENHLDQVQRGVARWYERLPGWGDQPLS